MVIRLVKPCKFHRPLYKICRQCWLALSSLTVHFPVFPLFRTPLQSISRQSLLPLGSAPFPSFAAICFVFPQPNVRRLALIFSGQYWNWARWCRRRYSGISSACCLLHTGLFCMHIEVLLACRGQIAFPWKSFPLLKLLSFQIGSHPRDFPYQFLYGQGLGSNDKRLSRSPRNPDVRTICVSFPSSFKRVLFMPCKKSDIILNMLHFIQKSWCVT